MNKVASIICCLFLGSSLLLAQPANDLCQNAINIGSPFLYQQLCVNGTNVGANPEFPYQFQNICATGSGMASPADDVWFRVTMPVGSNEMNINLTGTLSSYNIGIYSGSCGSLSGLGCATINSGAGINTTIRPTIQSTTYYIQVSGNGVGVQGTFNLCVTPDYNDQLCVVQSSLTANPPPSNGSYSPGTVVTFCYSVVDFEQQNANWFHGIAIQLGAGWQPGSITPTTIPASCDGNGQWLFVNSVTSSATGNTAGPGFFYDSNSGGSLDGNPGNNFGDNCTNNTWTFCWTATVPNLSPGQCQSANPDLSVVVRQYGDGQTGSWSSLSCTANPAFNFSSVLECCEQPIITVFDESCPNACDGIAIAEGQGGVAPYIYEWGNATLNDTVTGLCAGTINVTVTDALGCDAITTVVVGSGSGLALTTAKTDETCTGAGDGKAWVVNGSPSLTYTWNTTPPQTGDTAFALGAGTYRVTATGIAGCSATASVTVGSGNNLSVVLAKIDQTCAGAGDGKAWVVSGNPAFTYTWNTTPPQLTDTAFNLTNGTYSVTVTGPAGCNDVESITIGANPNFTLNLGKRDVTCNGADNGKAFVIGGSAAFTYTWNTVPPQVADTAINLAPGTYTVNAVGPAGCAATANITVVEPSPLTVVATADTTNCGGTGIGNVYAVAAGGTTNYSYSWNSTPPQNTATATNLPPGTYTVVVTDANGCAATTDATIISTPSFTTSIGSTSITCNGGSNGTAWAVPTGGLPPFTYVWNSVPPQFTDTARNLTAGTYTVVLTDANGCDDQFAITVSQSNALAVNYSIANAKCNGVADGTISLSVNGGTPPYAYLWSDASIAQNNDSLAPGTYSVTVTDANSCSITLGNLVVTEPTALSLTATPDSVTCYGGINGGVALNVSGGTPGYRYLWSNTRINPFLSFVTAGSYTVTVTDRNGCQDSISATVGQPDSFSVITVIDSVSCYGVADGAIDVQVSGASPPYQYQWSANTGNFTGTSLGNLPGATYQLTVTDSKGCEIDFSFNVAEPVRMLTFLEPNLDSTTCAGDIVSATITSSTVGGLPPYTYSWNTGDITQDLANIASYGDYTLQVTDSNGCTTNTTASLLPVLPLSVGFTSDSSGCYNDNSGTAEVFISGGIEPYFTLWAGLDSSNTTFVDRLAPGTYDVVVADSRGCDTTINFTITEQPEMTVTLPDTLTVLFGSDTTIDAQTSGIRPIDVATFYWNPAENLSCSDCEDPVLTSIRNRVYVLELNVNGCLYYDTLQLLVNFGPDPYYIPNAFTPNGDNTNDYFQVYGVGIKSVQYTIYNRWGGLVFNGEDINAAWDGTYNGSNAEAGTYIINAFFIYLDNRSEHITASFVLLR